MNTEFQNITHSFKTLVHNPNKYDKEALSLRETWWPVNTHASIIWYSTTTYLSHIIKVVVVVVVILWNENCWANGFILWNGRIWYFINSKDKKTNLRLDFLLTSSRLTYNMRSEFALSRPSLWTGTAGLVRKRLGFSDSEYLNSGLHFSKVWMMSVVNLATNCMNKQM